MSEKVMSKCKQNSFGHITCGRTPVKGFDGYCLYHAQFEQWIKTK